MMPPLMINETGAIPTCFPKQSDRARLASHHRVSPLTTLNMRAAGSTVTIAKTGMLP